MKQYFSSKKNIGHYFLDQIILPFLLSLISSNNTDLKVASSKTWDPNPQQILGKTVKRYLPYPEYGLQDT